MCILEWWKVLFWELLLVTSSSSFMQNSFVRRLRTRGTGGHTLRSVAHAAPFCAALRLAASEGIPASASRSRTSRSHHSGNGPLIARQQKVSKIYVSAGKVLLPFPPCHAASMSITTDCRCNS